MFLAHFDHTAPSPSRVRGWYDTDAFTYLNLPPAADLVEMTPTEWDARLTGIFGVQDGKVVPFVLPVQPLPVHQVAKVLLIERLAAVNKLRDLRRVLRYGVADGDLTNPELSLRERFDAATSVASDDGELLYLLAIIGADPVEILAP